MSKKKIYIITCSIIIIFVIVFVSGHVLTNRGHTQLDGPISVVERGPLTISFVESGTIKARDQIIIKNEVEGRTSIISLIPEGTHVKKGDLLIELDASSLEDEKIDQEIRVQNAEASYINSKENLAVVKNQAQSDVDLAKLTLEFAKQDLEKYIQGEYPYELDQADAEITLAEEELTRARETLEWSQQLYKEKYISQTELQADEISEKKKALDVQLAKTSKKLLTDFTYKRNFAQLESDVSQAEMALERTERKARADVIQAQADLKAKEAEYQRQMDKLKKIEEQIKKTKIYAPADGLVIHATSAKTGGFRHNIEPLEEGQDVREREELIYLPTGNSCKAEVSIHESNLEKTRIGLPTVITVDALPGKQFFGTVAHIAPLPDAQSMWMNPDLKVYTTEIYLNENDEVLRTGMSCQAEIVVQQYGDVINVPLQAVIRVGSEHTVYVKTGNSFKPRSVEIGFDNNKKVHVITGLEEGEIVLLTPPLKAAATDFQNGDGILKGLGPIDSITDGKPNILLPEERHISSGEMKINEDKTKINRGAVEEGFERHPLEQGGERKRFFENMTPEDREKMRKRIEAMTPEEKEKMKQRSRRMRPEK